MAWYENKPLFGTNICVTRSQKQGVKLREKLRDMGAEVTSISAIEIEPSPENLNEYMVIEVRLFLLFLIYHSKFQ